METSTISSSRSYHDLMLSSLCLSSQSENNTTSHISETNKNIEDVGNSDSQGEAVQYKRTSTISTMNELYPPCMSLDPETTDTDAAGAMNSTGRTCMDIHGATYYHDTRLRRPMSSYSKSRNDANTVDVHKLQLNLSYHGSTSGIEDGHDMYLYDDPILVEPKTPTDEGVPSAAANFSINNNIHNNHNEKDVYALAAVKALSVSATPISASSSYEESISMISMMQTPPPPPKLRVLPHSHSHELHTNHNPSSSLFLPDNYDESTQKPYTTMKATNLNFKTKSLSLTTPPLAPVPQSQSISFIETDEGCDHDGNNTNGMHTKNDSTLSALQLPHFETTSTLSTILSSAMTTTTFNSSKPSFQIQRSKPEFTHGPPSYSIPPPSSQQSLQRHPYDEETSFLNPNPSFTSKTSSLLFTSVPLDALHSIAGYLTPKDWAKVGLVSKDALVACREVFKKVKMHGFKCAVEIITSWVLGEHADARELATLYLKSGVPVYPAPYGHEYHTILWRMKLELDAMKKHKDMETTDSRTDTTRTTHEVQQTQQGEADINNDTSTTSDEDACIPFIDRFYSEHFDHPPRPNNHNPRIRSEPYFTYLEKKGIFWTNYHYKSKGIDPSPSVPSFLSDRAVTSSVRQSSSRRNMQNRRSPQHDYYPTDIEFFALFDDEEDLFNIDHVLEQGRIVGISDNVVVEPGDNYQLLNFDFGARRAAAQEGGDDRSRRRQRRNMQANASPNYATSLYTSENYAVVKGIKTRVNCHKHLYDQHLLQHIALEDDKGSIVQGELSLSVDFFHPNQPKSGENYYSKRPRMNGGNEHVNESDQHVESLWDLHIYNFESEYNDNCKNSSKRYLFKSNKGNNIKQWGKPDSTLFEIVEEYEKQLVYILGQCDYAAFDEFILDFWDEFFPITATIHYYDKFSPVPRSSYMRRFLSRPCPKAFGTVQCEIERIKIYSKRKGMNMAGRLGFPIYEYRLFIRDRRHHPTTQFEGPSLNEDNEPRMDTILMTAKHLSRNQQCSSYDRLASNRKGVNNYLFYMPQEEDIINHLNTVNESLNIDLCSQSEVPGAQFELGRLQSNFIGTEFQIFGPCNHKNTNTSPACNTSCAKEEKDSRNLGENSKRNLLRKLAKNSFRLPKRLRRHMHENETNNMINDHNRNRKGRISPWSSFSKKKVNRHNAAESGTEVAMDKELGAITYTANLLGNRPRVMDVCLPKLSSETGLSLLFESSSETNKEGIILGTLKRLSHQLLHVAPQQDRENDEVATDLDNLGLMSLQNRPPWWNVELGAFVLNFGGRVSVASVKNFQLCDRNDHEHIMLQFGRIEGRHSFTMDFSYPLSPLQAFAIAVSSLQSKISFA